MQTYTYTPLGPDEIRVLTIQPGAGDSQISISLDSIQLRPPTLVKTTGRLSPKDLQKTVPNGWNVWETVEGRILFDHNETDITSWTHPVEGFSKHLYSGVAQTLDTTSVPTFEALSYTWGLEEDSIVVDVADQTGLLTSGSSHGTLLIRPNLDAALRHLRYADRPRTIWIDAVCINQNDMQERNEQVRRMTDIYRSAARVVVWVGTATDDSGLAISKLDFLGQQLELTRDDYSVCHPDAVHGDWFRGPTVLPYDDATWRAFESLVQRPWFERLWIWQEVHLASKDSVLQCGDDCMPWTTFRRAVRRLFIATIEKSSQMSASFKSRVSHIDNLARPQSSTSFPAWMIVTAHAQCTNPRDRVYGLLGLAPPLYATTLKPDYSLSVSDVYKSAFLTELSTTDTLTLLSQCDLQHRSINAPSWVPDWSLERTTRTNGSASGFLASGRSSACAKYVSPSSLVTQGVMCGTISSTTTPSEGDRLIETICSWAPPGVQQSKYVTGESLLDAFLLTLCGDHIAGHFDNPVFPRLDDARSRFVVYTELQATNSTASSPDQFLPQVSRWTTGRIFVSTKEGYIGLAPIGTRVGDVVATLLGCPLPVVLRPASTGNHRLVGIGYIQGLMHAEKLLGPLPKDWVWKAKRTDTDTYSEGFYNHVTAEDTFNDPRLESLPTNWKIDTESTVSLLKLGTPRFVNVETGEVRETDPRLTPGAIKQRGVKLQSITLI